MGLKIGPPHWPRGVGLLLIKSVRIDGRSSFSFLLSHVFDSAGIVPWVGETPSYGSTGRKSLDVLQPKSPVHSAQQPLCSITGTVFLAVLGASLCVKVLATEG